MTGRRRGWLAMGVALTVVLAVVAVITAALAFLGLRQEVKDRQSADRAQTRAQVAQLRAEITAELDQRTVARNRSQAAQENRTRAAICTVLGSDLTPSRSVRALAVELGCPLDPATGRPVAPLPAAQPTPETAPEEPPTGPASPARPTPQPASPQPSTSRRPTARPTPRPSPSPTCRPLPLVGCPLGGTP